MGTKNTMRNLFMLAVVAIALALFKWDLLTGSGSTSIDPEAAKRADVVLFATSWCGYCAKARELLEKAGVPFVEHDIETSVEGKSQYDAIDGRGVPILLINGEIVRGYNPDLIVKLIQKSS